MMDNNVVHDVLAEVFSADEPPSGDASAAVFARAARLSTRHRMTTAAAATAAVAVTATVVVGAASLAGGRGSAGTGGLAVGGPAVGSPSATPSLECAATKCAEASPGRSRGGELGAPDFDVYDMLTRLLPSGGTVQKVGTQPGYAGVTVADARGTTQLDVNVQLDASGLGQMMDCAARHLPTGTRCNVVTQPDGTRILTSDGPNVEGPAGVEREVDLLYPDGRRVVIAEWNAVDEKRGETTRSTPWLTIDQLTALATAPDWRS
jgi:hypothetical protein